jgi:hypothetical protein
MNSCPNSSPNPKRVAAGRQNWLKRKGLTAAGRERLRLSALKNRPWLHTTGPRTAAGKTRSRANGRLRQTNAQSVRELSADLAEARNLIVEMKATCRSLTLSPLPIRNVVNP